MIMMMLIRDTLTTFAFLKGHCISMKNFGEHHRNLPVPLHSFLMLDFALRVLCMLNTYCTIDLHPRLVLVLKPCLFYLWTQSECSYNDGDGETYNPIFSLVITVLMSVSVDLN